MNELNDTTQAYENQPNYLKLNYPYPPYLT